MNRDFTEQLEAGMSLPELKQISQWLGYRFETNADGTEERMYRPDGSLALTARRASRLSNNISKLQAD